MALIDAGGWADDSTQKQTQQAFTPEEDFSVEKLSGNDGYMNMVRGYMTDRYNDGAQEEDESNEDYVERFLTNMRSFENRSLELGGQIDYLRQADEGQRKQFMNAYTLYNKLPGFTQKGGGSALGAVADYAYYNVVDPVNLVGLGVGGIAAKQLAKQGVKGLMKGLGTYGANFLVDGAIGAGFDVGLQKVEKETGIRDEYDLGRTATAFGLSGAGSAALQGVTSGVAKGYDKFGQQLGLKRDLKGELVGAAVEGGADAVDNVAAAANRMNTPIEQLSEFDYSRGKDILDQIEPNIKNPDLIEPEVKVEINKVITDVADRLFADPTMKLEKAADEQVSDALFRLFQNPEAVKRLDENALSGAISDAGLSADQFAAIYRTTVSDAGKQLNALSQLAKKLKAAGGLDLQASGRVKDYFDQKPIGVMGKAYDGALWLDRQRRALLVSSFQTTIRNAATTGIRGTIDTGADILDATAFYGIRKAQQLAGKDVPSYTIGDAFADGFGLFRNIADQGFSEDVVKATIGNNPKLLAQISRSLTDIGDGSLAKPVQIMNFFNMAHDSVVRRGIYAHSVEKQLRKITGKGVAETLADNGEVPKEIVQKAVREALEFTFANMPTNQPLNGMVKAIEAVPFIGTGIVTFPRFTAAAMQFTFDYVMGGHLAKGGSKLIEASSTGNSKQLQEGITNLSKGAIGAYVLFEAIDYRRKNQDTKWYEHKTNDKRTNDLRPFFPLAPYLLVADFLVKKSEGTLDRLAAKEIIEGLVGTRLAGSALYAIDGFYSALGTEGSGGFDGITGQRVSEVAGNFVGELVGGPASTNLVSSLVRDVARTFDAEEAKMRDTRQTIGNTAKDRFFEAAINAATRNIPYANQDKPPLESPTRGGDLYYQSPITTSITGIRSTQAKNALEQEMTRLGLMNMDINPSTGNKQFNAAVTKQLGELVDQGIVDVTTDEYAEMNDAEKFNYIKDRMSSSREVARDASLGDIYETTSQTVVGPDGEERTYTAKDKADWGRVPSRIRKQINLDYQKKYGTSVEAMGAYLEATEEASSIRGRYK